MFLDVFSLFKHVLVALLEKLKANFPHHTVSVIIKKLQTFAKSPKPFA